MPGMNTGLNVSDPTVVAAFKTALLHQGLDRPSHLPRRRPGVAQPARVAARRAQEAAPTSRARARTVLAAAAPVRVRDHLALRRHLAGPAEDGGRTAVAGDRADRGQLAALGAGGGELGRHRVVVSPDAGRRVRGMDSGRHRHMAARRARGPLSRLAGLISVGWGLVVWAFGESFGGIFAPGLTWLFGAPGAVLIYCVAGALIALPERAWRSRLPGQLTSAGAGRVPARHGRPAGLARPRLLAGQRGRPARLAGRHDRRDGPDSAAARVHLADQRVHDVRRSARVRRQLVRRHRARRDRRGVPHRPPPADPAGAGLLRCCAWRTGC